MLTLSAIVWVAGALFAGATAAEKGLSFTLYFLFGIIFSPLLTLIGLAGIPADQEKIDAEKIKEGKAVSCPSCLSAIPVDASVCRYCGRDTGI